MIFVCSQIDIAISKNGMRKKVIVMEYKSFKVIPKLMTYSKCKQWYFTLFNDILLNTFFI